MGQITIVFTETAYADLEDIETYISEDSPTIARRFVNKILSVPFFSFVFDLTNGEGKLKYLSFVRRVRKRQ